VRVEHEFGVDALVEFGVALWGILTTASGTPPNCELRSRCLQRALNVDSGRLRRKDAAMVYIITNAPSKSSRSASQRRAARPPNAFRRMAGSQIPLRVRTGSGTMTGRNARPHRSRPPRGGRRAARRSALTRTSLLSTNLASIQDRLGEPITIGVGGVERWRTPRKLRLSALCPRGLGHRQSHWPRRSSIKNRRRVPRRRNQEGNSHGNKA